MELLYFISGILSVGVLYGVRLLRSVKSSHTELLTRHQSQLNISSIRGEEFRQELEDLNILVRDIQSSMEKDQYESLSEINKKLSELNNMASKNSNDLKQSNQVFNKNVTEAFNEIMQLKNNIKVFMQDPNMSSRY
jgi:flagellar hook-basal body complex protein FliE|tara:strand:+ start:386 stop:793 length:408 start_codon:yes stop_codon:yes gene_type:complete